MMCSARAKYLPALTALRGIAALLVMIFHIDVLTHYRGLGTLIPHSSTGLVTKGYLWVDFFFILSGFIIRHTYGAAFGASFSFVNFRSYLLARFWRIYPLHLFCLVLLLIFVVLYPLINLNVLNDGSWLVYFDAVDFIRSVLLFNAHGQTGHLTWNIVSWSIGAEWWVYVVGVVLLVLMRSQRTHQAIALLLIAYLSLIALAYLHGDGSLDITYDLGVVRCFLGFSIGIALHVLYRRCSESKLLKSDAGFAVIAFAIVFALHLNAADVLLTPLFALLILFASINNGYPLRILNSRVLQFLGEISYSIYLMHGVIFMVFWFVLPSVVQHYSIVELNLWQQCLVWGAFISFTLIFASVTYRLVEKRFRHGLGARQNSGAIKKATLR